MPIEIFWWLLIFSAAGYLLVMLTITIGWFRIRRFEGQPRLPHINVSIVIAVRNEEKNIRRLLDSLHELDYPKTSLEIILVDDHSEDYTRKIIGAFRKENHIDHIILGKPEKYGKKAAIAHGIELAGGALIVTTDGDCEMEPQWLKRLVAFYQDHQPELTLGPVVYKQEKGILQKFFSLDFLSLVASGAGSVGAGRPIMGNAANMMFRRKLIREISENTAGEKFASGDDVFLIHKMMEEKGSKAIQYCRDPQAIIYTSPPEKLSDFIRQRIRWGSKAKGYRSVWAITVAVVVFLFNLMLVVTFVGGFFTSWLFVIYVLFVVLKYLVDLPLINDFANAVNKRKLKFYLLPFEFIYPFYIVFVAFISLFFKYDWKGRKGLR